MLYYVHMHCVVIYNVSIRSIPNSFILLKREIDPKGQHPKHYILSKKVEIIEDIHITTNGQ